MKNSGIWDPTRLQLSGFWLEGCFSSIRPKIGTGLRRFGDGLWQERGYLHPWYPHGPQQEGTGGDLSALSMHNQQPRLRSWLKAQPCSAHPPCPHPCLSCKAYDLFHALGGQEKAKLPSVPSDESRNLTPKCSRKKQRLLPKHPAKKNSWAQRQKALPEPG